MIKTNYTICLIRIIACLMIVWNHTSTFVLDGWGNPLNIANIGVQIFFVMSGWLYGGKPIENKKRWLKKNILKICIPYWIYLIFALPVIAFLTFNIVTWIKVLVAFCCLQGFGNQIEGMGQHWFLSYILLCYLVTAFILVKLPINKKRPLRVWITFLLSCLVWQIITIPLAYLIHFKVAYIFAYIFGYIYKLRFFNGKHQAEKKVIDYILILIFCIGLPFLVVLSSKAYLGIVENIVDLLDQWIKVFIGASLYVWIINILPNSIWDKSLNIKNALAKFGNYTFEIYIVHEFFTRDIFTRFIPLSIPIYLKVIVIWVFIGITAILLKILEKRALFYLKYKMKILECL